MSKKRVAVAVSGGVDSISALLRLRNAGCEVLALHGIFLDTQANNQLSLSLAARCHAWKIPFKSVNLVSEFDKLVVKPFIKGYREGLTPNPCAICNCQIKFAILKSAGEDAGCEYFATGHYARLVKNPYEAGAPFLLAPPVDTSKNQEYFLSLITGEKFRTVFFPLHSVKKEDLLAHLADMNFEISVYRESQDICFFSDKTVFFASHCKREKGPIFLLDPGGAVKKVGTHCGLENYTIGQRHGFNVVWSEPLYVVSKNHRENALYVATKKNAYMKSFSVRDVNWFVPYNLWDEEIYLRPRYRSRLLRVRVDIIDSSIHCQFYEPQFPVAPGQIAVFYDKNEYILAAGKIEEPDKFQVIQHA